jgi:NAD(P)-dependent dehydrogenase (short-subunit alcohol dehydrogenase family)
MAHAHYPDLSDRVVLVTGGANGIGEAHVRAFAQNGAKVAFLDIQEEPGNALEAEMRKEGAHVTFLHCDLVDLGALARAIEEVRRTLGPIFALINNAAVDKRQVFETIRADDFDWMMNINLRHVVFAAQKVIPHMREIGSGSIVNTSSVAWMRGLVDLQLYSTAKAAIVGFTNSLAREVGPYRIRANAIAPGLVLTPRQHQLWAERGGEQQLLDLQCLPDPISPMDVANTALFLCSDAGRAITKQCITINAGSL